ncbi:MAG: hypothetical protein E7554_09155 [Ruminococcaceae bacterium]|nr:hypothetical protein [Oscillospiraceae bacterium]
MGLTLSLDPLSGKLHDLARTAPENILAGASAVAEEMESVAKQNAPWTDRTGNARRTLAGFSKWDSTGSLVVGIAGHMHYSPRLELHYGGRYAILVPTVDSYAPIILAAVARAVTAQGGISNAQNP